MRRANLQEHVHSNLLSVFCFTVTSTTRLFHHWPILPCLSASRKHTKHRFDLIGRQFHFLELQLINSREATVLSSFVFKDSEQQHCLLRNTIIKCHVPSDLSLPGARANQIAISSFCPLFHFSARYFTFLPDISIRTARKLTNHI